MTVEDPIEYTVEGIMRDQLDPVLNQNDKDFIRSMMRQDQDVHLKIEAMVPSFK